MRMLWGGMDKLAMISKHILFRKRIRRPTSG
jgi:hypothetical protein